MRPLTLTLSAFGPYGDLVEIDLASLGTQGIYLITGDTGAGKTSIFDGISYALYGEPSGETRGAKELRSHYAKPQTPSFVELRFLYKNHPYTIRRSPEYERPSKRGGGMTKQSSSVTFTTKEGVILTKEKEVLAAIEALMGINKDQFTQVAMIAQGDFLKVLHATTSVRLEIFRKLFSTDRFHQLANHLSGETQVVKKKCEQLQLTVSHDIQNISYEPSGEQAYQDAVAEQSMEQILHYLQESNKTLEEKEKSLESGRIQLRQEVLSLSTEKTQEELRQKQVEAIAIEEASLLSLEKTVLDIGEQEEALSSQAPQKEALKEQILLLKQQMPIFAQLAQLSKQWNILVETEKNQQKALEQNKKDSLAWKERLATEKDKLETLVDAAILLKESSHQWEQLQQTQKSWEVFQKNLVELEGKYEEYKASQETYLSLSEIASQELSNFSQKQSSFLDQQAGILAESLVDKMPCPVCGSKDHPSPSVKEAHAPTGDEVKKAEKAYQTAQEKANLASRAAQGLKGQWEEKKNAITAQGTDLFPHIDLQGLEDFAPYKAEISTKSSLLQTEMAKIGAEIKQLEQQVKEKERLSLEIPKLEKALGEKNQETQDLNLSLLALAKDKEAVSNQKAEKEASLLYKSKDEAQTQQSTLEQDIEAYEKAVEKLGKEKKEIDTQKTALQSSIATRKKDIQSMPQGDLEKISSQIAEKEGKLLALDENMSTVSRVLANNQKILGSLEKTAQQLEEAQHNFMWMDALSKTANGAMTGKERVALETFVQITYFQRVLGKANVRLMQMTSGQYELERSQETSGKSQVGLELNILDHHSGKTRSVKSLSGGESFKASLALALGLSDEIQSNKGGIQLDTMFIDEGFGSLDEDSLRQALSVLHQLSGGNRLVGIISHVSELKEKIDQKIIVKKIPSQGSSMELHLS